jgi:hypothetical protein
MYNSSWLKGDKYNLTSFNVYVKKGRKRVDCGRIEYKCGAALKDHLIEIPAEYLKKKRAELELEFENSGVTFASSESLKKILSSKN